MARLAAEHVYLIRVFKFACIADIFLMCLLLPETGTEVLEHHRTQSDGSQKPARYVCCVL